MRKEKLPKLLSKIALSISMTACILTGCSPNSPGTDPSSGTNTGFASQQNMESGETAALDTSEEVVLKMFAICDAPLNQRLADEYYPILNEAVKEAVNATIEYTYASGNDYANNYQLALASGEKYDLLHAANWFGYTEHAKKGAYMPLDDLLPIYAPHIWEEYADLWDSVRVDGKIYGIPSTGGDRAEPSFFYREDLRKKYDCPEIDSLDAIETYLQAIKDNEPELLPSDDSQAMVYGNSFIPLSKYQIIDTMGGRNSNFVIDPSNPRKVLSTIELPEYKEYMYKMKEFSDKGFWPKDVLSKNDWGVYSVINGKSAASFVGQFWNYSYLIPQTESEHPDWELKFVPYCTMNPDSVLPTADPTGNLISVARNAENPERALMLIDYVHTHEDLWRLMCWGIEGTHYQITDGKYDETFLADPSTDKFNYFPGILLFNDENFNLPKINEWDEQAAIEEQMKSMEQPNILAGFVFDQTPISAEYTAINQIRMEYGYPLNVGIVDDVDASYEDYVKRSKDAGLDKCREEVERQLNEFFDATGRVD